MTRKTTQTEAQTEAPAVELAAPETGGSYERQPDGSLKLLSDVVEIVSEPTGEQPADEEQEG